MAFHRSPEPCAHAVLNAYGAEHTIPIPIEALCGNHGMRVRQAHFNDQDIAGMIQRGPGKTAVIYVNKTHSVPDQRFTAAHELGHCLMHLHPHQPGLIERGDIHARDRRNSDQIPDEQAANRFAAAVLMPTAVIRECRDLYSPDRLAAFLVVSPESLTIRLQNA